MWLIFGLFGHLHVKYDDKKRLHLLFNALSGDTSELENLSFLFLIGEYFGYVVVSFLMV